TVIVPCDASETKNGTIAAANIFGPVYLRLGRSGVPAMTSKDDVFTIGKSMMLRDGRDVAIFACGQMVSEGALACDILAKDGISARLINMHTVKPIDKEAIIKAAKETGAIVTAEEHTVMGGFGSAVSEVVSQEFPVPLKMVGVKDRFGLSGEPDELFKYFGLTADDIVKAAKEAIRMKKR
ncbi:MAG: transketolase C-terminal domain-containing protein, partial [Candidatus Omnitrophota bacterium]